MHWAPRLQAEDGGRIVNTRLTKAAEAVLAANSNCSCYERCDCLDDALYGLREALAEAKAEAPAAPSEEARAIAELQSMLDRYPHHSAHQLRQIIAQRIAALRAQAPGSDAAGGG
jgi:predicted negative regulator of RcsB-dependent stress response